jgi:hypothetical protein
MEARGGVRRDTEKFRKAEELRQEQVAMPTPALAPPPETPCLYRPYPSSQKGGTLVAEAVRDFATERALMCSPDGYWPACCPTCGHGLMHSHDSRTRLCQLEDAPPVIEIARHRCAHPDGGARWQTLPGFLARHLHFKWHRVEHACGGRADRTRGRRPSIWTVARWCSRLRSSASRLVRLFAGAGRPVRTVVRTRRELLEALGVPYAEVAAWVHALLPGVRLM